MLPYHRRSFLGYRLLQEFFTLPAKFLFVDVTGIGKVWNRGFQELGGIDVSVFRRGRRRPAAQIGNRHRRPARSVSARCRSSICFRRRPSRFCSINTSRSTRSIPDIRRPNATEVFSVDEVSARSIPPRGRSSPTGRFTLIGTTSRSTGNECFWIANRRDFQPLGRRCLRDLSFPGGSRHASLGAGQGHSHGAHHLHEPQSARRNCPSAIKTETLRWKATRR